MVDSREVTCKNCQTEFEVFFKDPSRYLNYICTVCRYDMENEMTDLEVKTPQLWISESGKKYKYIDDKMEHPQDEMYFSYDNKPEPVVFEISESLYDAILYNHHSEHLMNGTQPNIGNDYQLLYEKLCFLQRFIKDATYISPQSISSYDVAYKALLDASNGIALIGQALLDKVPFKLRRRK